MWIQHHTFISLSTYERNNLLIYDTYRRRLDYMYRYCDVLETGQDLAQSTIKKFFLKIWN